MTHTIDEKEKRAVKRSTVMKFTLITSAISVAGLISIAAPTCSAETIGQPGSFSYAQTEPAPDSVKSAVGTKAKKPRSSRARKSNTHAYGFITEYYDNNILNYSDTDRTLFGTGTNPKRYDPLKNLDDYVTDLGARFTYESGGRRSEMWRVRLKGDATLFAHNRFRNYTLWGLEMRRNIRRSYVEVGVTWLPNYKLRNLYWRPMANRPLGVRYAAADFKRITYDAQLGIALSRRLDGRIDISAGTTNYKSPFDERDNSTVNESMRLTYDVSKRVTVYGGFGFVQSRADGRNLPPSEIVRDSNYVNPVQSVPRDISYNATTAEIGGRVKCDRRGRVIAAGSLDYQHQKYTSQKPLDTGHNGRIDHDYDLNLSLSWRASDRLQPELNYEYRKSSSNVAAGVAEFGSFTGYRLGAQLTAYF